MMSTFPPRLADLLDLALNLATDYTAALSIGDRDRADWDTFCDRLDAIRRQIP